MRVALLHLSHKDLIYAVSAWITYMAERKHRTRLMRKGHQALMRVARPQLVAGFKFWRADYDQAVASGWMKAPSESPLASCLKK